MQILIAGGSGFLGQALTSALLKKGDWVTVLSRTPEKLPAKPALTAKKIGDLTAQDYFDVVINLSGEGIADARWSESRKAALLRSRLDTTQALIDWMQTAAQRPKRFLSGSAIGWYGAQGEQVLTESSAAHDEFVHQLCQKWEQSAQQAAALCIPTVLLRTGVVLHPSGGMLGRVLLPFKLGLGGRLGDGQQWLSWISREDWVAALLFLLDQPDLSGAINLTAPNPVRNVEFTQTLAKSLHRLAFLPAPAWVLKMLLGEMSGLLLDSQRVLPKRLEDAGFVFQHPTLQGALAEMV